MCTALVNRTNSSYQIISQVSETITNKIFQGTTNERGSVDIIKPHRVVNDNIMVRFLYMENMVEDSI